MLVAGGGTGATSLKIAMQLKERGVAGAAVTHLDLSEASIAIARTQAATLGLSVRFVRGSILELDALQLGTFHFINCDGVLHHMQDPARGLLMLRNALTVGGGIGMMLYTEYGRSGVTAVQRAIKLLQLEGSAQQKAQTVRKLIEALPPTHLLKKNKHFLQAAERDTEVVDTYLHPMDHTYSVAQLLELVAHSSMRVVEMTPPAAYNPQYGHLLTRNGSMQLFSAAVSSMSREQRWEFAEATQGTALARHACYLVRESDPRPSTRNVYQRAIHIPCVLRTAAVQLLLARAQSNIQQQHKPYNFQIVIDSEVIDACSCSWCL